MARPVKQTVDYFPHDCDHGQTMFIIEQKFGNDGYAAWYKLLEMLGRSRGHFLDCNIEESWEFLQAKTHLSGEKLLEIINTLARLGAIDSDLWAKKIIWSQNFIDRISSVYMNRRQTAPDRPGNGRIKDNYIVSTDNNPITTANNPISGLETPQSKVKETKLKESIVLTDCQQQLLKELRKLPQWGESLEDAEWLIEFKQEFPKFWLQHIRGCRDYHSRKGKHSKALWKTRLRNWMGHERQVESPDQVAYQKL